MLNADRPQHDPVWLRSFINSHGGPIPITPNHWLPFVWLIISSCTLIALTPPTPKWKLVRASMLPLLLSYQIYFCVFTVDTPRLKHWGNITGNIWHFIKALDLLLFYPAEEYYYRIRPKHGWNKAGPPGEVEGDVEMVAEPVPPHRTMAKFYWTLNLWFSQTQPLVFPKRRWMELPSTHTGQFSKTPLHPTIQSDQFPPQPQLILVRCIPNIGSDKIVHDL